MRSFGMWFLAGLIGLFGYDAFERKARGNYQAPGTQERGSAPELRVMEDGNPDPGPDGRI